MREGYIATKLKFYELPFWTYGLEQDGQTDGQHQCVLWSCFDEEQYFLKKQKTTNDREVTPGEMIDNNNLKRQITQHFVAD